MNIETIIEMAKDIATVTGLSKHEIEFDYDGGVNTVRLGYVGVGDNWRIHSPIHGIRKAGTLKEMVELALEVCKRPMTKAHKFAREHGWDAEDCERFILAFNSDTFDDGSRIIIKDDKVIVER